MTQPRPRDLVDALPAYVPGKRPPSGAGITAYKLSSNENPHPPLPSVLAVVRDAAAEINRYPDLAVTGLTEALSAHLGVPPECLATGTGSVAVLGHLLSALCNPGDEVVYAWRSFEAYPIVATLAGATSVRVPLTADARHDLSAMAQAVTARTKVVLVCTPNNPTGPAVTDAELREFLAAVPPEVLVVVDEAYVEFDDRSDAADALAIWRDHPNVALLRTFSKAYGLAGLRVGYAVAHPDIAGAARKVATPFGVNSLAQVAAVASLAVTAELRERVTQLVAERTRVRQALLAQGWEVPDARGNFVWLPLGRDAAAFVDRCMDAALSVRGFPGDGVRISIGEVAANDRFLDLAAAFRLEQA